MNAAVEAESISESPKQRASDLDPGVETAPGPANLHGLMMLARRVQAALTPVEPRPAFLTDLRAQLAAARPQATAAAAARALDKERRLRWAAGLGGALYWIGVSVVSWRAAQTVGGRLAALVSARVARPGLPKSLTPT